MNQSFLSVYPKLIGLNNSEQNNPLLSGLWLVHGDEPIITQWTLDAIRPYWLKMGRNIKRIELSSSKTWYEVINELDSLSLFDPANVILVTGNHKPDKDVQQLLLDFAKRVHHELQIDSSDAQSHLIWVMPKQDKKSQSSKWMQCFINNGVVVDCNVYNEKQRQQVLQTQANKFGVDLTAEAWHFLMTHTQKNLLNAYQTIWQLSYLVATGMDENTNSLESSLHINEANQLNKVIINEIDIQSALVAGSIYSIYDLSDAMLNDDAKAVFTILQALKDAQESPIKVLWAVAKDMRLIQLLHNGSDPSSIGIWRSKERLYRTAANRIKPSDTLGWSELIFDCDRAVKGLIKQPVWELLLKSALEVVGLRLFKKHDNIST